MIKKKYRLKQREVKKVLSRGKPFFSYNIVLNYLENKKGYNRFSIVLGAKSIKTNVERNFFRRRFFNLINNFIKIQLKDTYDIVFVVKKQTKFNKKQQESINNFEKDVEFLIKKIF